MIRSALAACLAGAVLALTACPAPAERGRHQRSEYQQRVRDPGQGEEGGLPGRLDHDQQQPKPGRHRQEGS